MGRPPATPEQRERVRRRRAWAARTEREALRTLRGRHFPEFLRILGAVRDACPEPGAGPA